MTVYRNDEISLDELVALKPTQLVVSPGPGELSPASGLILGTYQRREKAIQTQMLESVRMQFDTSLVKYQS